MDPMSAMGGKLSSPLFKSVTPIPPLPGREGLGVGAAEALGGSVQDCLKHSVRILIQLVVPHAQDRPPFPHEERIPPRIALRPGMLAAVELDDQLRLPAREVGKIRPDRKLTRKLRPKPGDHSPKHALMPRRSAAKFAGTLGLIEGNAHAHVPSLSASRASRTHPPMVEMSIHQALAAGWDPQSRGKALVFRPHNPH